METWKVGPRYKLISVLGCGSYGAVCKAVDLNARNRLVALKRIPDALTTLECAKRVLREVVVLNRLNHPNIIKIFNIFFTPATSGARKFDPATFTLVPVSIDLYMAFELAEGGDLYEMRGEMSATEVRSLMYQLTSAVKYLHDAGVWHRDIKSANTLCGRNKVGGRVVKICDFGLARGATRSDRTAVDEDDDDAMMTNDEDDDASAASPPLRKRSRVTPPPVGGGVSTFAREDMLTGIVATPCYRAPEVIMSDGMYTGAMDVWALGCIFAELLQRQQQHGFTPNLTVSPLFRFDDEPIPQPGTAEMYTTWAIAAGGTGVPGQDIEMASAAAVKENRVKARLNLFFDVVGTPSWHDVAAVSSPRWRRYLRGIRGRPGSLMQQYGGCADASRDLLLRMLTFDPKRRAIPDEILAHEYFLEDDQPRSPHAQVPHASPLRVKIGTGLRMHPVAEHEGATAMEADTDAAAVALEGACKDDDETFDDVDEDVHGLKSFWAISEPRGALAALEAVFAAIAREERMAANSNGAWRDSFREMFTHECERHTRSGNDFPPDGTPEVALSSYDTDHAPDVHAPGGLHATFPSFFRAGEKPVMYTGSDRTRWSSEPDAQREDQIALESRYLGGAPGTTGVYGQGGTGVGTTVRSVWVAKGGARDDAEMGVGTAVGHLTENRHGEWLEWDLPSSQKFGKGVTFGGEEFITSPRAATAVWGVSAVPPGMSTEEGDLYCTTSNQQSR